MNPKATQHSLIKAMLDVIVVLQVNTFVVFLALCFAVARASWGAEELSDLTLEGRVELLGRMADLAEQNYRKINTWELIYDIVDEAGWSGEQLKGIGLDTPPPGAEPWRRRDSGTVRLLYDCERNAVRAEVTRTKATLFQDALRTPLDIPLSLPVSQTTLIVKDDFYYLEPTLDYADFPEVPAMQGRAGRVAFREPKETARRLRNANAIDPRDLFAYTRPFWEEFRMAARMLNQALESNDAAMVGEMGRLFRFYEVNYPHGNETVKVILVELRVRRPGTSAEGPVRTIRIRASPSHDYNFVGVNVSDESGKDVEIVNWQYMNHQGVWIPSHWSRVLLNSEGTPTHGRVLKLKECRLNAPIDRLKFTVQGLGLKDGERVLDRVDRVCYIYNEGELTSPVSFDSPVPSKPESSSGGIDRRLIWLNLGGLALVLVLTVLRRRRNTAVNDGVSQ